MELEDLEDPGATTHQAERTEEAIQEEKREFLEQHSNGELEEAGIQRGKSLLIYTRELKKDSKDDLMPGQRIGRMVKSTEKDMFDDSIQILKEKTKVYDIDIQMK